MSFNNSIKPYLELCRISNLPSIWTNVLAALLLSTQRFSAGHYLLLAFALSAFYLAGMCLNDICDLPHDRRFRPERPLPAGRMTLRSAWILTLTLFSIGFVLLALAPAGQGLVVGVILTVVIVCYDLWHKHNPYSVLLMAGCRFLVFATVSTALTGGFATLPALGAGVQFVYVIALSLVARFDNSRPDFFNWPVIPWLLAGICLLDGVLLALFIHTGWLLAGVLGAALMLFAQRLVRGD